MASGCPCRTRSIVSLLLVNHSDQSKTKRSQVAFSWDGEHQDNFDIYVKLMNQVPGLTD